MSSSFMGFGGLLFSLPMLIGQWVGILGLGKVNRNAAWWCMMSGICCTTLGTISSVITMGLLISNIRSLSSGGLQFFFLIPYGLSGLGSLLFAIGFAIHGQQASRVHQRITELEAIAAAQGEELNRHRTS
jgi:hypothetical protein